MTTEDYKSYRIQVFTRESPDEGCNFNVAIFSEGGDQTIVKQWSGNASTCQEAEKRAIEFAKKWIDDQIVQ